ncbi:hypothetical protein ACFQS1_27250 [Paractinoplanes rhizophilus]|uniref:Universal stress protein family protein n=1 Tax=Paractinoplanes rhizophilus TaxID=1416877 RepID=A0ABW2HWY0_9ACTN
MNGAVLAGILDVASADDVLRLAFEEAQQRGADLRVMATAPHAELTDTVDRWSAKYPDVPVSVVIRHVIDPAITLAAATRTCCLAVLARPTDTRATAVVRAVARRAGCPLVIA